MRVVEIFDSIDGEGAHAGYLSTFIRLAGCNLRCEYCDTKYAQERNNGEDLSYIDILNRVGAIGNQHVTITGGEPCLHLLDLEQLVSNLLTHGYCVNIETNGSKNVRRLLQQGCDVTLDYKLPSAGKEANKAMDMSNWACLRETDAIKFVCQESDFPEIERMLCRYKTKAQIYLSPIWGKCDLEKLVDFQKSMRAFNPRIQVQLHKIIWGPDAMGV